MSCRTSIIGETSCSKKKSQSIATLAVIGVFLSWFFNIIDLRQALWVLVGIAGVAAAPTIVAAVFS